MTKEAEKSLSWLRSYWNHQPPAEIAKSEIQLFSKEVNKITIGEFYQWLLSEGYIFKNKDAK